jgi:putative transposase
VSTRNVQLAFGEFYHLYNRGTDKRVIYLDAADYQRFIELLYLANTTHAVNMRIIRRDLNSVFEFERGEPLVAIGAYCLMPNHFHILATPLVENGLSIFMNKVSTGYSMYFNKKYDRTGSLFQGTFKSQHVDSDEYFKYLYAYIHLNPVKLIDPSWKEKGIKDVKEAYEFVCAFQYSSLRDYVGENREAQKILNKECFPNYFQTHAQTKDELLEWLNYNPIQL